MLNKFPKTHHFDFSKSVNLDDMVSTNFNHLIGEEIVLLEKLDGENTSIYKNDWHARSLDSHYNYTRSYIKQMYETIRYLIPENINSLIGENVSYYHSIEYNNLLGFFYMFQASDNDNNYISYDELLGLADELDLPTPRELYRGVFDIKKIKIISEKINNEIKSDIGSSIEGFVMRPVVRFPIADYNKYTAKYVRPGHVQPNVGDSITHWLKNTYPNKLKDVYAVKPSYMSYTKKIKNAI